MNEMRQAAFKVYTLLGANEEDIRKRNQFMLCVERGCLVPQLSLIHGTEQKQCLSHGYY